MDKWAAKYAVPGSGPLARFICIGCAGPQLAKTFGDELRLRNCINTVAERSPTWGQLGCNGFIVLDGLGNVVCPATSAFLKVRGAAFEHVELLLDALLTSHSLDAVQRAAAASSSGRGCSSGGEDDGG